MPIGLTGLIHKVRKTEKRKLAPTTKEEPVLA